MTDLLETCPAPPSWSCRWSDLASRFEWVRALGTCPQDPVHHAEGDVGIHTRMVLDALASFPTFRDLPEEERLAVYLAALLHDVAKPETTRIEDDGRVTARGHSRRGAVRTRRILWELGLPFALRERVCNLVLHHQLPFFLVERDDAERLAITVSQVVPCRLLAIVALADAVGRTCADGRRLRDNIALFEELCRERGCWDGPFPFPSAHSRFLYFRTPGRSPDYHAHDDTRGEVVVLSGLPGSGKDRWLAQAAPELPVVSLDAIRDELGVDPTDHQAPVLDRARAEARARLRRGEPFAWNATSLSREMRSRIVSLAADYRARLRIVYVEAPAPALFAQNRARARSVPEAVIERLLGRWEVPDLTEAHEVRYEVP